MKPKTKEQKKIDDFYWKERKVGQVKWIWASDEKGEENSGHISTCPICAGRLKWNGSFKRDGEFYNFVRCRHCDAEFKICLYHNPDDKKVKKAMGIDENAF